MAMQTINDPLDPTKPKQVQAADPLATQGMPSALPNAAMGISQLPDGLGGSVTVPPTTMAPPGIIPPSLTPSAGPNINVIPGGAGPSLAPGAAPAAPSAPTSAVPGASTFSADQNLINNQINPTGSPRLLGAQAQTDAAMNAVQNGPDRAALGQQYYDNYAARAKSNFDRGITDATNAAAAHGQIGSGMLTNHYGDLAERFNLDNTTAASDFATHALEGTIGDRLNNANLARSVESQVYGQDAGARNEVRGERDYQQNLAQQAIARRIQQQQAEQAGQAQDFNQGMDLYGLGSRYDPTGAYENAAALSSAEAGSNSADVGQLLRYLAMNRGGYPGGY